MYLVFDLILHLLRGRCINYPNNENVRFTPIILHFQCKDSCLSHHKYLLDALVEITSFASAFSSLWSSLPAGEALPCLHFSPILSCLLVSPKGTRGMCWAPSSVPPWVSAVSSMPGRNLEWLGYLWAWSSLRTGKNNWSLWNLLTYIWEAGFGACTELSCQKSHYLRAPENSLAVSVTTAFKPYYMCPPLFQWWMHLN